MRAPRAEVIAPFKTIIRKRVRKYETTGVANQIQSLSITYKTIFQQAARVLHDGGLDSVNLDRNQWRSRYEPEVL
jgi:hypothetical protein